MEPHVLVKLRDGRDGQVYKVYVCAEDAEKVTNDKSFGARLLQHAKNNYKGDENSVQVIMDHKFLHSEETETEEDLKHVENRIEYFEKLQARIWTYKDTLAFIKSVKDHYQDLNHPKKRKEVWNVVSEELQALNIDVTPKSCHTKWRNLIRTYNAVHHSKANGRNIVRFKFFDELNEIFGGKPTHTPKKFIDSETLLLQNKIEFIHLPNEDEAENSSAPSTSSVANCNNNSNKRKRVDKTDELVKALLKYVKVKQAIYKDEVLRREIANKNREKRHKEKLALKQKRLKIEEERVGLLRIYLESKKLKKLEAETKS